MSTGSRDARFGPALRWAASSLAAIAVSSSTAAPASAGTTYAPPQPAATDAARNEAPPAFDLAAFGRDLYEQRCSNCHALSPTTSSLAPPLHDVIGRRAGSAAGYQYSVKLAGSDLVWNAATLDAWLEKSTIATPDIRFRHVGMKDAIERLAVVTYIAAAGKAADADRK